MTSTGPWKVRFTCRSTGKSQVWGYRTARAAWAAVNLAGNCDADTSATFLGKDQ